MVTKTYRHAPLVSAILESPRYRFYQELYRQRHPPSVVRGPPKPKPKQPDDAHTTVTESHTLRSSGKAISPYSSITEASPQGSDLAKQFNALIAAAPEKEIYFTVLDATFGIGSHTRSLLRRSKKLLRVVGMDVDGSLANPFGADLKRRYRSRFTFLEGALRSSRNLFDDRTFDGILLDLNGPCKAQLYDDRRGFDLNSAFDGPCTLSYAQPQTAFSALNGRSQSLPRFLNEASYEDLMDVLSERAGLAYRDANGLANTILRQRPFRGVYSIAAVLKRFLGDTLVDDRFLSKTSQSSGEHIAARRDKSYRTICALRERINNDREEFQAFVRFIPHLLKPLGRCAIVCSQPWQIDALQVFEEKDPKMYCPRYPTDNLWVFQKHSKLAFPLKLSQTLGAIPKVRPAPEDDLETMLRQPGLRFDPEEYPADA